MKYDDELAVNDFSVVIPEELRVLVRRELETDVLSETYHQYKIWLFI